MSDWTYIDQTTHHRYDPARGAETGARSPAPGNQTAEDVIVPWRSCDDTVWELGSLVANRFVLQTHLGRGRYGEVYEALDRALSDPQMKQEHYVALHLLHDQIRNQTRLLQKLEDSYRQPHFWSHPNVVKVSSFGCDRGKYFLVTELLQGASLRFILDEASPGLLSQEESFAVLRGVGDALKYAHAKGAIHGDIRPEKVFVTAEFVVKVLDLLPASSVRTVPFFIEDTAAEGLVTPDRRDDVYGLACLAYELLSGRHPFNANSPLEAVNAGLIAAPIAGLGRRQWDALARGLTLRREQRTASVAQFLEELGVTGLEKLRPAHSETVPNLPNVSTMALRPAIASDTNVPVLGDYSVPDDFTATPATAGARPEPKPRSQAQPRPERVARSELAVRSQRRARDFAATPKYAQPREPRELRTGLGLASLALVAAVGIAAYLNYELLRSRTADLFAAGVAFIENKDVAAQRTARTGTEGPRRAESETAAVVSPEPSAPVTTELVAEIVVDEPPPAAAADVAQPARFEFAAELVTISEGQAIAPAVIRRVGGRLGPASVVWWTSDGTAAADDDYANFGRRVETFAAGEETRTIHIPIVVDSIAEARESFYLNLGESQQPGRRLEPAEQIEIVIVDDDF